MHILVEELLDRLIVACSPAPKRILADRRTYTWSVKLMLLHHMGLIDAGLFRNLEGLNRLRNEFAHRVEVELVEAFDKGFMARSGAAAFPRPGLTRTRFRDDPRDRGTEILTRIRKLTLDWLIATCRRRVSGL